MNWNKIIVSSGLALAVVTATVATAQARPGARGAGSGGGFRASAPMSGSARTTVAPSGRSGNFNRGNGNWQGGNHGHWNPHGHRGHGSYYPYFGYYPFGYGYGYPYFGASSALYYNGYYNGYAGNGYAGGGSVAVEVQQELARAGYYRGEIDGIIGDGTRRAIRGYERANGLRVDGRIDSELVSSLGLD